MNNLSKKGRLVGWLFVAPALLGSLIFAVYPAISGIALAFTKSGIAGSSFVGLDNFVEMFQSDFFLKAFKNTLLYTAVILPFVVVVPLAVAILLTHTGKLFQFFGRFALYVPTITAGVGVILFWRTILHPTKGLLNKLLGTDVVWLGSNPEALFSTAFLVFISVLGPPILYYSAGLGTISRTLYEAAQSMGASKWQEIKIITIPLIAPMIALIALINTCGLLQVWETPYMMTGGGPNYGTSTLAMDIYRLGIVHGRWGYGAAYAVVLLVMIVFFVILQRRISK